MNESVYDGGGTRAAPYDAAREGLKAAGERIVGLARSIGIMPEDSAAAAPQIPEADETGELRKQLEDAMARETELRKEPAEERGNLEIAKAGLKAANPGYSARISPVADSDVAIGSLFDRLQRPEFVLQRTRGLLRFTPGFNSCRLWRREQSGSNVEGSRKKSIRDTHVSKRREKRAPSAFPFSICDWPYTEAR